MLGSLTMTRVLVYANQPFPISETFAYNQTFRLERYEAFVLGAKAPRGPSISVPRDRLYLINRGGKSGLLRELRFKLLGHIPADVESWVATIGPRLVHAHFGPAGAVILPLAEKLRLPLVVSFHGTDATMKDSWVWLRSHVAHRIYILRRRWLAKRANKVVVPSEFLRKIVVERHGFPEEKVVVVRHGVDLTKFRPETASPEWGHILYVGRLIERKGLPYLLAALNMVKDRFPGLQLTVIGDGPMRASYERMAKSLLGERVRFLGAQPHDVVLDHMRRAYIFAMPSITMPSGEAETFGVVFLEAMAMGVPPVSFRSGGIPEVVVHGEVGFLAEERNVGELAYYISKLLEDGDLRNSFGERGRDWVRREFDLRLRLAELENVYDALLKGAE